MSDAERDLVKMVASVFDKLPSDERKYIIGYMDGANAMARKEGMENDVLETAEICESAGSDGAEGNADQ